MQQQLDVQFTIHIPPDQVMVTKIEYNELKQSELSGVYWTMQDLEKRIGRGNVWIRENILLRRKFREDLDCEHGGFVFYPKAKGQNWSFHALKMAEFLDRHFNSIFKK